MERGLLEEWLQRAATLPSSSLSSSISAASTQQIAQAWAQTRDCVENGVLEAQHFAALSFLRECVYRIHIGDSHAKLLLSILSSVEGTDGVPDNALTHARGSAALLLSVWLRRGFAGRSSKVTSPHHQKFLDSVVSSILKALESSTQNGSFVSEAILLLGSVCVTNDVQEEQRRVCQEAISQKFAQQQHYVGRRICKEALAGVGYAMVSSSGLMLRTLLQALLSSWADDEGTSSPSLENGLLLLHLMEWYGMSQRQHLDFLEIAVDEIGKASSAHTIVMARCAPMLSAAGLLRSFHLRQFGGGTTKESTKSSWVSFVQSLNSIIIRMVGETTQSHEQKIIEEIQSRDFVDTAVVEAEKPFSVAQLGNKHWNHCFAIAMSRCARFPANASILFCLISTFLEDVLPLRAYYDVTMSQVPEQSEGALAMHVESILFSEAGAILRVVCEQYQSADVEWQRWTENLLSHYSFSIYASHRYFLAQAESRKQDGLSNAVSTNDMGVISKVLEAALISVVLFFSVASKGKTDADIYTKGRFAAQVMHCLSCIEFIRQGQVPEYRELVQRCVSWVSASEATCAILTSIFPSYERIIHLPGRAISSYCWRKDNVQDSRVLFGFRVLPPCLPTFPDESFSNEVAPIMYLYMKHPNQALVQASHSVLVSFLSSKPKDSKGYFESDRDPREGYKRCRERERDPIKEQLAVRFIERTFEERPILSHYDSFVMGVGAIARQLPAGSTAMKGCITSLSRRASACFRLASSGESNDTGQENNLETGKKLQTLLLHLILIVDVQVLPHLLQEVARLMLGQMDPHRLYALEEAFDILAGSEDLTRKHILVPWLQSLSYLCSNLDEPRRSPSTKSSKRQKKRRSRKGYDNEVDGGHGEGAVAFNPSSATFLGKPEADVSRVSKSRL